MSISKRLINYLNPINRLGNTKYSIIFPLIVSLSTALLLQAYFQFILQDPTAIGLYAIGLFVALIIYFSFRDGILGGFLVTLVTVCYYLYLIHILNYQGRQFVSGVDTTIVLGVIYAFLSFTIGWLKQTIDSLIDREANEKRRLHTIIEQLPVGVLITNGKGEITQANRQADIILGRKTPIGFQVGSDNLVPSSQNGKLLNPAHTPLLHVLQTGRPVIGKEFLLHRPDGKNVNLRVSAAPIHSKLGRVIAAAIIFTDITQQKELESRKDDFVNMASHELKTPITSMKLYLDVLSKEIKGYKNEKSIRILNNVKSQTQKLQELVNDLLDVSRLQTGKLTFHKEKFRLDQFLDETLEQLRGTSAYQKLIFEKKHPVLVEADKFRLYQVLANLVSNAVKYSSGTGDIIVGLHRKNGNAIVSVKDFGIGISKNQQKKIFERLYQVGDEKEKTFPGFGMGLYISKEIIKRHKGKIWVESEKDSGSTFYFSLPLTK